MQETTESVNVYPTDPFRALNARFLSIVFAACAVFVALLTAACRIEAEAQSSNTMTPGEDWIQLFNGKDLSGWTPVGAESWTAEEDGVLHGKGLTKAYGYLETDKD